MKTVGPFSRSSLELKKKTASSAYSEKLRSYLVVRSFYSVRSSMVTSFSRVQTSGFGTGHFMVSSAACIMKRSKMGTLHEPCRTPIELSISESTEPIFTLIFEVL
jgi:hypothetical protein